MTLFQAFGQFAGQAGVGVPTYGMDTIIPSSATVAGSGSETVTINANGSVTIANATSVTINGIFSSTFENYLMVADVITSSTSPELAWRLASGGTPDTAGNYDYVYVNAENTSYTVATSTAQTFALISEVTTNLTGVQTYFYGPAQTRQTYSRCVSALSSSGARILEYAALHNLTSSYDGITLLCNNGIAYDMTVMFYGVNP